MCDDHAPIDAPQQAGRVLSRRRFGQFVGAAVGAAALGRLWTPTRARAALEPSSDGLAAHSMAMHQHASFSEQTGSMDGALDQATRTGVNVIWWTDHDHRMQAMDFRREVHFTSLTAERTDGKPWIWTAQKSGQLRSTSGGIVSSPSSPLDPIQGGSLSVGCRGRTTQPATLGYVADDQHAARNFHGNGFGEQLSIEVRPTSVGANGYLELLVSTSEHPALNGRPAGVYQLSYRFGGPGTPGSRQTTGLLGIVTVAVTVGQWNSVTVTPSDDIAALWPDLPPQDFATSGIRLGAVSLGAWTAGYFDYLRFSRPYATGDVPLQLQQQLAQGYATKYPAVTQRQGLEVSRFLPHLNWFGGAVTLPDTSAFSHANNSPAYEQWLAQLSVQVHAAGGLLSYNHPFGFGSFALLPPATQDAQLSQIAAHLLAEDVLGCDILEVGYVARNGVDLAHHLGLWDVLSRHGRFTTGNGVTDDHFGTNWLGIGNNWTTTAWAPTDAEADLLHALLSGRVFTSSLSSFQGSLDLWADGSCPMGSVSVSSLPTRQLQVNAVGLASDSSVEVLRGDVDAGDTVPNTVLVGTVPASAFTTGTTSVPIDTTSPCFVRVQVRNSSGAVVAASNPVWLLQTAPQGGIPEARAA